MSPVKRLLATVIGIVLFAIAATLGFMLFLALLAVGAIAAGIFALRLWWWRRRFQRAQPSPAGDGSPQGSTGNRSATVIDGEYRVVDRHRS